MNPSLKRAASVTALTLAVVGYALLLWRGPWWIDGDHLRTQDLQPADGVVITGVRTALVALGAGGLGAAGLYYTHQTLRQTRKRDTEQAEAMAEGQINDRYVEAVKLLAHEDSLTQRLGGIYALERNMHDSRRDHPTVIAILSAFVRGAAAVPQDDAEFTGDPGLWVRHRLRQDVQAALDVIARRPALTPPVRPNLCAVDLRAARLDGVCLTTADLVDADLTGADLTGADLSGADLSGADLSGAWLHGANLAGADLSGTSMDGAALHGARLDHAVVNGTSFADTRLHGASLVGVDLSNADLLRTDFTGADLTGAVLGEGLADLGLVGLDPGRSSGAPAARAVPAAPPAPGVRPIR
ncbi:pentapeptide repeat-containing protein [Streptomyces halstedii]|uniref:pentapeptide repeat-containing protein n=1 Tax=Streptomyces halstedii TaxID=1944 RepID=UPI00345FCB81|nr:pentapeptide repeat-containing protein [Streptomyces halstedii]